jgi:hypothetical protein
MKTESAAAGTIGAELVSRLIATYVDPRKEAEAAYESEDAASAAEYLLTHELGAVIDLMHGDDVYPEMTFELGVQFGIEATVATLNSPPQLACDTVSELFANLKGDLRERMESARRSMLLRAV